jgi:ligand-binding SRPBCC domain-containing protein
VPPRLRSQPRHLKYTLSLTINAPRAVVWEAFNNPDYLKEWQPTLESITPVSGLPGQPGSIAEQAYIEGGRQLTMVETIKERREPELFVAIYEAGGAINQMKSIFEEKGNKTIWTTASDFQFMGYMIFVGPFMRRAFIKRTRRSMELFKALVEGKEQ